ncbi:MAG: hypothetical protein L0Y66_10630, partial [Myxococcaceae bacterium]|nr:hypothetical protein [Myxococcaceae bacterium]
SQLPAGRLSPEDNDAPGVLCDATSSGPGGERGTPGDPNTSCAQATPDAGVGGCLDAERGVRRPPVVPGVGDLVLHELMQNPLGGDADREYVEVYVSRDVDLHGVSLANATATGRTALSAEVCLPVRAGSHLVLARERDAVLNGGLTDVDATFGFSLGNAATEGEPDRAVQLWHGELLLDEVRYRASTEGVAAQLRPAYRSASGNDALDAFCTSAAAPTYGEGGVGTPGGPNVCP